ncbi:hypothetical protein JYG24_12635 [Lentisphaerota bacterium]|nr:hypothetical protein JYG24_12635 [Lentisphaerota bacterium]
MSESLPPNKSGSAACAVTTVEQTTVSEAAAEQSIKVETANKAFRKQLPS